MSEKAKKFYATSMPGKSHIFIKTLEGAIEDAKQKLIKDSEIEYYIVEIIHKVKRDIPVIITDYVGFGEDDA